jgi:tubulin polyglutamylase TTLL5
MSQNLVRYLHFKNWSGITLTDVPDNGYYFKFSSGAVKLVKGLLEDNGFKVQHFENIIIVLFF